jgi:serine/threonine protein kinase
LKRIPRSKIVSEQQKTRLEAEKFILQQATSPFLCRGFESFETDEEVALLQEYVEGRALYECVWKFRDSGRFPEQITKFFAAQLVLALRDLHSRGFAHRDLKSGNVLVGADGFAKVIDFGLSKKVAGDGETTDRTQSLCGTHYVMAPEVFFREPCGVTIDWWWVVQLPCVVLRSLFALMCSEFLSCRSLGVVVYEMVVGHPPWEYQCPPGCSMEDYFHRIKATARDPFKNSQREGTPHPSAELQSLIL